MLALLSEYIVSLSLVSNNGSNSKLHPYVEQREDHAQVSLAASALHSLLEVGQHHWFQLESSNVWLHYYLPVLRVGLAISLRLLLSDLELVPSLKLPRDQEYWLEVLGLQLSIPR